MEQRQETTIIQDLRKNIDAALNPKLEIKEESSKNLDELRTSLSYCYLLPDSRNSLSYDFIDAASYLEDYILRGIEAAENFITQAIQENPIEVKEMLKNPAFSQLNVDFQKQKIIKLNEQILVFEHNGRNNERVMAYLDESMRFDIKDTKTYINDWLQDIEPAEHFVIQAIEENFDLVNEIFTAETRRLGQKTEKLFQLLMDNAPNNIDIMSFIAKGYALFFLAEKEPERIAALLEKAYSADCLNEIFKLENCQAVLLERDNKGLCSLAYFKTSDLLLKICRNMKRSDSKSIKSIILCETNSPSIETIMFNCYLTVQSEGMRQLFTTVLTELNNDIEDNIDSALTKPMGHNRSLFIKFDKEISFDYYIASMNQDANRLLELATTKNPVQFENLLKSELEFFKYSGSYNLLSKRQDFYKAIKHHKMMSEYTFKENTLATLNKHLVNAGCITIEEPQKSTKPPTSSNSFGDHFAGFFNMLKPKKTLFKNNSPNDPQSESSELKEITSTSRKNFNDYEVPDSFEYK